MYACESWAIKKAVPNNWCFQIVVLEKTLKSPLDCKEIKPVNSKGNDSWIFIRRTDAEARAWPHVAPHDVKSRLIKKRPWFQEGLKVGGKVDDREWDG